MAPTCGRVQVGCLGPHVTKHMILLGPGVQVLAFLHRILCQPAIMSQKILCVGVEGFASLFKPFLPRHLQSIVHKVFPALYSLQSSTIMVLSHLTLRLLCAKLGYSSEVLAISLRWRCRILFPLGTSWASWSLTCNSLLRLAMFASLLVPPKPFMFEYRTLP